MLELIKDIVFYTSALAGVVLICLFILGTVINWYLNRALKQVEKIEKLQGK